MSKENFIGQNIKRVRLLNSYSQEDVAKYLGVSYQQFQKYETGTNRISVDSFLKVAEFLKIHPMALINDNNLSPDNDKEIIQLVALFKKIQDPKQRAAIKKLLKSYTE